MVVTQNPISREVPTLPQLDSELPEGEARLRPWSTGLAPEASVKVRCVKEQSGHCKHINSKVILCQL